MATSDQPTTLTQASSSVIIHRAAYASIQDSGRIGFEDIGVGRGGFADARHAELANLLVANLAGAALIEVFTGAFALEFLRDIDFATAGAACDLYLDGARVQIGARVHARRTQRLVLRKVSAGRILYLAFAGGIAMPPVLGSSATDLGSGFGGVEGRLLRTKDVLNTAFREKALSCSRAWLVTNLPDLTALRLILAHNCPHSLTEPFLSTQWRVSLQSQRNGLRLECAGSDDTRMPTPEHDGISRGVVPGVIQLPPNGLPIVLGVDAQTVGGYFVLGAVITVDLWRIAQAVPGQNISFQAVTIEQARALSNARHVQRARLELAVSAGITQAA